MRRGNRIAVVGLVVPSRGCLALARPEADPACGIGPTNAMSMIRRLQAKVADGLYRLASPGELC